MLLNNPVFLTVNDQQVEMSNLDIVTIDHASRKIVLARLGPIFRPLVLWRGNDYDTAGDYTKAQVEAKILELLGDNPQETLQSLVL
jgi:hypothetical protein